MTKENKIYFIEVYDEENEFLGQEEYPSLLAAYDAAKDIPEMYGEFDHLEIVDSEDLNRVYYTFSTFNGGKIHEWELRELINNRNNAAEVEIENAKNAAEVEIENADKSAAEEEYCYYLKNNRPIFGAVPSGYIRADKGEIKVRRRVYFGAVYYNKPLSGKQIVNYDLQPADVSEMEKVNGYFVECDLINCIYDYATDADAAAEVEIENAKNAAKGFTLVRQGKLGDISQFTYATLDEAKVGLKNAIADGFVWAGIKNSAGEIIDELDAAKVEVKKFEVGKIYTSNGKYFKVVKRETGNFVTMIDTATGEKIRRKSLIANDKETFYPTVAGKAIQATDEISDTLKAKVAEIKNRPHKSCIDWTDALFQNVTVPEIFKAQKELKKYLKLGQIELAENVFNNIKLMFKAA